MRRWRGIATALVLSVAYLPAAATGQDGFESRGGTQVDVTDPPVVTMNVAIDMVVSDPEKDGLRDDLNHMQTAIMDYWNNNLPIASDCLILEIVVEIDPVSKSAVRMIEVDGRETPVTTPGRHVVYWGGNEANAPWPETYDPYDDDQVASTGEDYTTPFEHEVWAVWSGHLQTDRDFAHEFGHLLGLADDYRKSGLPVPERQGTLMADGDAIDEVLANRIAEVARRAGADLPECWSGTLDLSARYGSICQAHWTADVSFTLSGDAVSESAPTLALGDTDCPGRVLEPPLELRARRVDGGIHLAWISTEQGERVFGVAAGDGEIAREGTRAEGTFQNTYGDASAATTFESTWSLHCSSCDDAQPPD